MQSSHDKVPGSTTEEQDKLDESFPATAHPSKKRRALGLNQWQKGRLNLL